MTRAVTLRDARSARGVSKRTLKDVWSPQRGNRRQVDVYLPPSYAETRRRYPVIYMHDGQNLSDPATAFAGTWQLPTALARLAERGHEAIVVGVHNAGRERLAEYSPFADSRHGGGEGDRYLAFLVETLKPSIDRRFRTRRDREGTAIFGSSLGGLISLYAYFARPDVFGRAGAMSPALWFGDRAIFDYLTGAGAPRGRIYVDVGSAEGAATRRDARRLARLLAAKGYRRNESLVYIEAPGAPHQEAAWARRIEAAVGFLIAEGEMSVL